MEIITINGANAKNTILNILTNEIECVVLGIDDKSYVICGNNQVQLSNKLIGKTELIQVPNAGGIIVTSKGDIELGHFSKDLRNNFNKALANNLVQYLIQNNINASIAGNDILIDDAYKVASFSSTCYNNILYSAFHVSINIDLELIRDICTKPMSKIPKGLSSYGIETNTIMEFLKESICH